MKSILKYRFLSALVMLSCCIVIMQLGNSVFGNELDDEIKNFENLTNVYHLILREYIEERGRSSLIHSAIKGMVQDLDPFSEVLTKEELDDLELTSVGKYAGIGINVQAKDGVYIVTQVFKSSPAESAGLAAGDVVVKINDVQLAGISDIELQRLVQGKSGTTVGISYYHPHKPEDVIVKLVKRDWILTNSVEFHQLNRDVGVLRIYQFIKRTPEEIKHYLAGKKFRALILDLRNNPGGLLLSAVETAELFLDIGPIVETRNRNNQVIDKYISNRVHKEPKPHIIVLINRYSASASEILAGALKDRKEGIVVGEKSFGKGVVQSIYPLDNEIYVKLTTARFYTPAGISFHGNGILPDVEVTDTLESSRYDHSDKIFQKALDLIQKKTQISIQPALN